MALRWDPLWTKVMGAWEPLQVREKDISIYTPREMYLKALKEGGQLVADSPTVNSMNGRPWEMFTVLEGETRDHVRFKVPGKGEEPSS